METYSYFSAWNLYLRGYSYELSGYVRAKNFISSCPYRTPNPMQRIADQLYNGIPAAR